VKAIFMSHPFLERCLPLRLIPR